MQLVQYFLLYVCLTLVLHSADYILCAAWIVLAILGLGFQYFWSRGRPAFPRSPYVEQKWIRKYYDRKEFDERTPILINDDTRPNNIC